VKFNVLEQQHLDEYRTNFEKDGALERRFQKVIIDPSTKEETS
jgi:ATP-dependent Clp protease ATP-binding subunit ClpC